MASGWFKMTQRSLSQHSESTQRAHRRHSENTSREIREQSDFVIPSEPKILCLVFTYTQVCFGKETITVFAKLFPDLVVVLSS